LIGFIGVLTRTAFCPFRLLRYRSCERDGRDAHKSMKKKIMADV
jgi:hypothetical protein